MLVSPLARGNLQHPQLWLQLRMDDCARIVFGQSTLVVASAPCSAYYAVCPNDEALTAWSVD
jgi:hypothetical protein